MDILENLRSLNEPVPNPPYLPTRAELENVEEKLGVQFPPSYVKYQLEYSDITYGHLELYHLFEDESHLDMISNVEAARLNHELPDHLVPFVEEQDGEYYCFDLRSAAPEYEVVYWSHDGTSREKWSSFLEWVEKCWMGEQ